jgi:predicted HTH transcriptional regulator
VLKNVNYTGDQETDFGINFGINFGLNETQQRIIDLLIENPLVTTQAVADSLGLTRRTVENYISQLKKAGLVEREGARKNGRWIVKAENGYD